MTLPRALALSLVLVASQASAQTPGRDLLLPLGGNANKPVVSLDFTQGNTANFQNNVIVSRPSQATITDATGALTYAPNNIVTYSNTFSNGNWTKSGLTIAQNATDPFGVANNAWTLTATSTTAVVYQNVSPGPTPTLISAYVNYGTSPYCYIQINFGSGGGIFATSFNLSNGTIGTNNWNVSGTGGSLSNPKMTAVGNGWYEVSVYASGLPTNYINIGLAAADATRSATINQTMQLADVTTSAVTYETTPRPVDQVVTAGSRYYGPAFDYAPGWAANSFSWLRIEGARTNLFLNTASPATQTITVANASAYANSFYGTGTLTLSGALTQVMTGSAGARTIYDGTTASTSLVATVSSLTTTAYPQVELGAFATSTIPQAGSATARSADSVSSTGALSTALAAGPWAYTWTSETTLTTSCVTGAAGAFTWPNYGWMKSLKVYKAGTPTAKVTC